MESALLLPLSLEISLIVFKKEGKVNGIKK